MSIAYSIHDRIPVKIDSIEVKVSPLSYIQKAELQSEMISASSGDMKAIMSAAFKAIKYAVKEVKGIKKRDGEDFVLEFDGIVLSDYCVNSILNMEQTSKLTSVCAALLDGIPREITDPRTNLPLEGVEFNTPGK